MDSSTGYGQISYGINPDVANNRMDFYFQHGSGRDQLYRWTGTINNGDYIEMRIINNGTQWIEAYVNGVFAHAIKNNSYTEFTTVFIEVESSATIDNYNVTYVTTELVTTTTPTFVIPTPSDGAYNNTNQTINMSCGDDINMRYTLWFDGNANPINPVLDNTTHGNWSMNISVDGTYYYKGACYNSSSGIASGNSSIRSFNLDITTPTLTINTNNFFNATNNMSTVNQYLNNITLNVSATDNDNIFAFLYNITKDGVVYYNYSNTSVNDDTFNFTRNLNITLWPSGVYDIEVAVADGHHYVGGYQIGNYDITKSKDKITFTTTEGNVVKISSTDATATQYTKEVNSYAFGFNYLSASSTKTFIVESDTKIHYLPDSNYKAHFVIWNGKNGNWVDFEGVGKDYTVKKINDYRYDITFTGLPLTTEVISKSIGGLNVRREYYQWYRGTYDYFAQEVYSTQSSVMMLNVTKNDDFINNMDVTLSYNNTDYTVTTAEYTNYITYTSTVTSPSVTVTTYIPYSWNLTINQTNNVHTYNFTIADNQTVIRYAIDNCTDYYMHTLNVSLMNISTEDYVGGTINYIFSYWRAANPTFILNYSGTTVMGNQTFCIYPNSTSLVSNILFDYQIGGTSYEYSTYQLTLTNASQLILLYGTPGTTRVTLSVRDTNDNPVENAYIKVMKYDISTNSFKTVEVVTTNDDGETIANIVLFTTWYRFMVEYNGVTYLTTISTKVFTITKDFVIDLAATDWFVNYDTKTGVATNLSYNNITYTFTYTFTDPSGAMHEGCLKVVERAARGDTLIGNTCVESTSSSILITITNTTGDIKGRTYIATGYLKFDRIYVTDVLSKIFPGARFIYSKTGGREIGLLTAFMTTAAMVFIGIWNPVVAIVLLLIGVFTTSVLGLWQLTVPWLVTIVIMGLLILFKMRQR